MIIVCKTHFDIGYTELARNVVQRYRTSMIDNALRIVDDSRRLPPEQRFVWTVSGWPMQQMLWPGQKPERRRRIEKRSARAAWSGTPCRPACTPNRWTWKTWSAAWTSPRPFPGSSASRCRATRR